MQTGNGSMSSPTTRYLYGAAVDQVFAQENSNVSWFMKDDQGSTQYLVNNFNGQPVSHYVYDAFGRVTSGDTSLTRYLYTGRELDTSTGLQYNRERWYDSNTGRWITPDPIGFAAGQSNLYEYVGNGPTDATDPTGLDFIAVADRPVLGTGGLAKHYSLEYWESKCPAPVAIAYQINGHLLQSDSIQESAGMSVDRVPAIVGDPNARKIEGVELLADTSGWIGLTNRGIIWTALRGNKLNVWIAFITHSDSATRLIPVKNGATKADWINVLALADSYGYAEHPLPQPFTGPLPRTFAFANWPMSNYAAMGTNSNVFIRWLVGASGMTMIELTGSHPPENVSTPFPNDPNILPVKPFKT